MSQHLFSTSYNGSPITVIVGWDRPLQGFFCCVERDDGDGDDFVYSNLDDPKLCGSFGVCSTLAYFEEQLAALGIQVPRSMFDQTEADRRGNVGNRYVCHEADGSFA